MPVVLSIQSGLQPGGLAWRQRGIVRGCEPGAAGKYRIAGWANTWRNETDCSGRRNQAVALPRRGTLERPNSGGRPLSVVGIRTLPPGLVESSFPRRLHCGSRNHPQRMGNGQGQDHLGVLLAQGRSGNDGGAGGHVSARHELSERGAQEGAGRVLRRLATRRFGEETAGRLSRLLKEMSGPEDMDKMSDALIDCRCGEEFIDRVRATF